MADVSTVIAANRKAVARGVVQTAPHRFIEIHTRHHRKQMPV